MKVTIEIDPNTITKIIEVDGQTYTRQIRRSPAGAFQWPREWQDDLGKYPELTNAVCEASMSAIDIADELEQLTRSLTVE